MPRVLGCFFIYPSVARKGEGGLTKSLKYAKKKSMEGEEKTNNINFSNKVGFIKK